MHPFFAIGLPHGMEWLWIAGFFLVLLPAVVIGFGFLIGVGLRAGMKDRKKKT